MNSVLWFVVLLYSFCCIQGQDTVYPTSRPTGGYVAPSNHFVSRTLKPSSSLLTSATPTVGHGAGIGGADNEEEAIKEETQTALDSSYVILFGLVFLVLVVVMYYAYKRYAATHKPDTAANQKYSPLQTDDPDEFFSRENIEMAMMHNRGGLGY